MTKYLLICASSVLLLVGQVQSVYGQPAAIGLNRAAPGVPDDAPAGKSLFDDPKWKAIRAKQLQGAVVVRSSLALRAAAPSVLPINRIFGGVPSDEDDFPGCVAVLTESGGLCTGTLVAPQVVVSAAHCLFDDQGRSVKARTVYIGLDVRNRQQEREYKVQSQQAHQDYNASTSKNDIAVLILDRPVSTEHATPHRIADEALLLANELVTLVGYGFTETRQIGKQFNVEVPYLNSGCGSFGCIEGNEIVAGEEQHSRDTCNGDSGGPAYIHTTGSTFVLAGITSRAIRGAKEDPATGLVCGTGGIYVRADKYFDFIREVATRAGVDSPSKNSDPEDVPAAPTNDVSAEATARKELIQSLESLLKILKEKP